MTRQWYPYRDKQRDLPRFFCAGCGEEQYTYDGEAVPGLCLECSRRARKREEDAMTLREMSVEYRAQVQVLRDRIQELEQARAASGDPGERSRLEGRIHLLTTIWRETRDQAVLLERYYERGYRRNGRYTI